MKKSLFTGAFLLGIASLFAQEIKIEPADIDFGKVKLNNQLTSKVKITNIGTEPLLLKNVQGSCSCTVPEFPKTPIAPGKSADITVKYDTGSSKGEFNKTVTIYSNDVKASRKFFRVKGTVE